MAAKGSNFRIFVDGVEKLVVNHSEYATGRLGVFGFNSTAAADNLKAYAMGEVSKLIINMPLDQVFVPFNVPLTATGELPDGTQLPVDNDKVIFTSSDPSIVTFEGNVMVPKAVGEASIQAVLGEVASAPLSVNVEAIDDLTLEIAQTRTAAGLSVPYTLTTTLNDGTQYNLLGNSSVVLGMMSSNESVAALTNAGFAASKKAGRADLSVQVDVGDRIVESNKVTVNPYDPKAQTVYFHDDFEDGDIDGWKAYGSTWSNKDNALVGQNASGDTWNIYQNAEASDFVYSADVTLVAGLSVGTSFRMTETGGQLYGYDVILDTNNNWLNLCRRDPGWVSLASYRLTVEKGRTYNITVVADGSLIKVYLDGIERISYVDTKYSTGKFGVFHYRYSNDSNPSEGRYDNLTATAIPGPEPDPVITSMTVNPDTLVADYAANVLVYAEADGLGEGQSLQAYLALNGEAVTDSFPIIDGKVIVHVPKSVLNAGIYDVVVQVSGTQITDSRPITVEPNDPGLWTPQITENNEGYLSIRFAAAIGSAKTGYAVVIDGKAVAVALDADGQTLVTDFLYDQLNGVRTIVIKGIKYPKLFPSYSFTFTLPVEN